MKRAQRSLARLMALVAIILISSHVRADGNEVKPKEVWDGSVQDLKLMKDVPPVITNAKTLEKLWKEWKVDDKVPKMDFTKEIVVVQTTPGKLIGRPM